MPKSAAESWFPHRGANMERAKELRNRAALCRLAAAVPTSGSSRADRVLTLLAQALDREAAEVERLHHITVGQSPAGEPSRPRA
jgi:hypothetical protein